MSYPLEPPGILPVGTSTNNLHHLTVIPPADSMPLPMFDEGQPSTIFSGKKDKLRVTIENPPTLMQVDGDTTSSQDSSKMPGEYSFIRFILIFYEND